MSKPFGAVRVRVTVETWTDSGLGEDNGYWRRQPDEVDILNYAGTLHCFAPEEQDESVSAGLLRGYLKALHNVKAEGDEG